MVNVALILDFEFKGDLLNLANNMPVWIVSSKFNDKLIEKTRNFFHDNRITTIYFVNNESIDFIFLRSLNEIDEHHGLESSPAPYTVVNVFGVSPNIVTKDILKEFSFDSIRIMDDSFQLYK